MFNQLMKKNFDSHAYIYDLHSNMQKSMAKNLYRHIKKTGNGLKKIFEIGCGTGYMSGLLIKFKPDILFLNDLAGNMLDTAKHKLEKKYSSVIKFIENDFEEYQFDKKFDLIASNAMLQWIVDIKKTFYKIKTGLNNKGRLAFSIFISGTFNELDLSFKKTYEQLDLPFENHILNFYDEEYIKSIIINTGFKILKFEVKDYRQFYNNPLDFLKELRSIGASHFNEKNVRYKIMKNMIKNYNKFFKNNKRRIPVTYRVLYCVAEN